MENNNYFAEYLKQQRDEDLRKSLIKDKLSTTMYERQIVKEVDANGNELFREVDVPNPVPELLVEDWATTNFPRKDKRIKRACWALGLAYNSILSFMKAKGKDSQGNFKVDMSPALSFLTHTTSMILLSEKANDSELTDKVLRQHIRQESREFIEQKQPQGGFLAPKSQL